MDSQNTISSINSVSSSSSDDSLSSTTSSSLTILSPASSNASSSPPAPSSFENQTTLNRPVFKSSWSSPTTLSQPSMPPLPDLVVSTPRRSSTASSIASSSSSSSFASYLPQHHNPPPLPPIPAIYSTSSRKSHAEEFRPQVQHVKQLEDKRARTRAILAAQATPKKSEPRRRSTAPLASRVASEGIEVVVDTARERDTPARRGAGDRSSSFGALEDARKNLARRSGFGIPLPMTSRPESSVFLGDNNGSIKSNSNRSSFVGDLSTSPLESTPSFPLPRDPNPPSDDDSPRFHPQRSQSTPSVGVGMESRPFLPTRTRTVSFAESPAHIIDDDPFLLGSSDEEDEIDGGSEKRKKSSGSKKGWWSKGKKRVQSIFSPRTTPPPAPLPSSTTLVEDSNSSSSPSSSPTPPAKSPNTFQRLFRPPNLPYSNSSFKWAGGSAPDLRTTLASSNNGSSASLREAVVKPATEERRRSVFDPVRAGERGAATMGRKGVVAVQLTDAQLQRRLGRMEDTEERRVAESLFL